jgi:hypothetical protein
MNASNNEIGQNERKELKMFPLVWIIGAAVAGVAALASSGDDDSDSDFESVEREARHRAEKERRKREEATRKRIEAEREARHRQEVRDDFERLAATKFREFKMKTKLSGNFCLAVGDCGFSNFATDTRTVSEQVKKSIAARLEPMRKERDGYSAKIKEIRDILSLLEHARV